MEILGAFCFTLAAAAVGEIETVQQRGEAAPLIPACEAACEEVLDQFHNLAWQEAPAADDLHQLFDAAGRLVAAVQQHWAEPAQQARHRLALAQVAAARCCAYLRCANVEQRGGPAAGEGEGSKKCRWCVCYGVCALNSPEQLVHCGAAGARQLLLMLHPTSLSQPL